MQIVRFFYGIDGNCQGDAAIELVDGPKLPAVNGYPNGLELAISAAASRLDLTLPCYRATTLELFGGLEVCGIASRMNKLGKNVVTGQLLDTLIEKVFYAPRRDLNDLVGQGVDANGPPDLRHGRLTKFEASFATAVSDSITIEAADAHEKFIG